MKVKVKTRKEIESLFKNDEPSYGDIHVESDIDVEGRIDGVYVLKEMVKYYDTMIECVDFWGGPHDTIRLEGSEYYWPLKAVHIDKELKVELIKFKLSGLKRKEIWHKS